ncbi:MAG: type pilus assembly protein PilB [Solirubrobacteraceae bacterium]|jgi:type IV pilus assembly protein PilB|nr:type pilus assembly protein PilB [Solirubrobacteraceae bacterium]
MSESNIHHLRPVSGGADVAAALEPDHGSDGITAPSRRGGSGRFLTDVLIELGYVDREAVERAVEAARASVAGRAPEQVLLDTGAVTADQLARATAERYGLDHIDLNAFEVDMSAANLVSASAARRYEAVPVAYVDARTLRVVMSDPSNVLAVDDIAMLTGLEVRAAVASRDDIANLVGRLNRFEDAVKEAYDEERDDSGAEVVELQESADDAPVVKLVHSIIAQAAERGASDIHFEPDGRDMRVRVRIDGVMSTTTTVPRRMVAGVVSRVKIMAELNIAERRLPQDGRMGLLVEGRHIDIRVVTLPSVIGESVVMRILDKESVVLELDRLGMQEAERERFERAFTKSHGGVLVTGPTGSGKSTTLYGALGVLNTPEKNIITIEDPVEFEVEGVTQVQVNPRTGLTFATGLRSMMRADPDVIMVGEIRDHETAQIAVEGALTGHLVLSTLHTNDAPTAMTRLIEMGIEPFLVASAVDCVVAQRLARMLCSVCKKRTIISAEVLRNHGFSASFDLEAYEPGGCGRCRGMGYKGRIGLYEVMTMTDEIRRLAIERAPADRIAEVAMRDGMRRLRDDGLEKVKQGRTSIAEVARVTGTG